MGQCFLKKSNNEDCKNKWQRSPQKESLGIDSFDPSEFNYCERNYEKVNDWIGISDLTN